MFNNNLVQLDESPGGVKREYREVKRKAAVGDRIKVTGADSCTYRYSRGDILTVTDANRWKDGKGVTAGPLDSALFHKEYVVLEKTDIIRIDNERLRMVDRKAAVGERVIIVNIRYQRSVDETLAVGQIGVCTCDDEFEDASIDTTLTHDWCGFLNAERVEYRVLESVESAQSAAPAVPLSAQPSALLSERSSRDQAAANISALTAKVQALESRVATIEAANQPVKVAEGPADDAPPSFAFCAHTPQQLRDEIVERAKADVKALLDRNYYAGYSPTIWFTDKDGSFITDMCDFIVNRKKRTVVALISVIRGGKPFRKGIAKAAPNDVFNAHIGRAIALRRALGLEVPAEYLNVPNPEEPRVGDVVKYLSYSGPVYAIRPEKRTVGGADIGTVFHASERGLTFMTTVGSVNYEMWAPINGTAIIDDSREEVGA